MKVLLGSSAEEPMSAKNLLGAPNNNEDPDNEILIEKLEESDIEDRSLSSLSAVPINRRK